MLQKNTPGHAHAISVLNRDVGSCSSPCTLFAKLADRLLPDICPHPNTHVAASANRPPRCEYQNPAEVLPWFRHVHTAGTLYKNIYTRWLPALASERDGWHILITYNDFGGLLALFIMATNELNENYETERRTFIGNLFGYGISDDNCKSDRGNASGNESKQAVAVGPQPYRFDRALRASSATRDWCTTRRRYTVNVGKIDGQHDFSNPAYF